MIQEAIDAMKVDGEPVQFLIAQWKKFGDHESNASTYNFSDREVGQLLKSYDLVLRALKLAVSQRDGYIGSYVWSKGGDQDMIDSKAEQRNKEITDLLASGKDGR